MASLKRIGVSLSLAVAAASGTAYVADTMVPAAMHTAFGDTAENN
jgi:hypothetical protein